MQAETWETSKENLQPVKAGRKPDVLLKAPLTPGKSYKADLEGERRYVLADGCQHASQHSALGPFCCLTR